MVTVSGQANGRGKWSRRTMWANGRGERFTRAVGADGVCDGRENDMAGGVGNGLVAV